MNTRAKRTPTTLRPERGRKRRTKYARRVRDPKYLAFVRLWPCIACFRAVWMSWADRDRETLGLWALQWNSEAMHTGPHGISQKASDSTALPGCRLHHHELDHGIGKAFWRKYGLNRTKLIARLHAAYRESGGVLAE